MIMPFDDQFFMREALKEARKAFEADEVPIGAVITTGDKIIARAHNSTEALGDITAHAEIMAITAAQNYLGAKFLTDCDIYITIEPCVMCAGALRWARCRRVIWGSDEPKFGFSTFNKEILHPKTLVTRGIMEEECRELMRRFFSEKRK